jgi:hypothetical protein
MTSSLKAEILRLRKPIQKANRFATLRITRWVGLWFALSAVCAAQQGGAPAEPLTIRTTSLPKAYLGQAYEGHLSAHGGGTPYKWEIKEGTLPAGVTLHPEGVLIGVPAEVGEFRITVLVRDSGSPAYELQQNLVLVVVAPLFLQWGKYPAVHGKRIEGSVLVSNQTDGDFDLTVVVVAVDENGRATALGYQHFPLKKNTAQTEIPFGENLPPGSYQVNLDGVGELPPATIYRARLVPKERFAIAGEP